MQYTQGEKNIVLSPPYDITHTLIYASIGNHMALKIKKSKAFPDRNELITLGTTAGINKSAEIIDFLADNISDYIADSAEIRLMDGLRASIERSLAIANSKGAVLKKYSHLKKKNTSKSQSNL